MSNNKDLQIKIPDPYLDSVKAVKDEIGEMKKLINWAMTFIIGILLVGFLTLLFMVAGLVLDTWRFDSTIYKENTTLGLNSNIVQVNQNNQKDILNALSKIESMMSH